MTTTATREQGTEPRDRAELHTGDLAGLLLLRLGLGGVLVWFGVAELHSPAAWAVFVPHLFHAVQTPLMFLHATLLLVTGAFLAVGMFHRLAAWLGGLILLAILGALIMTGAVDSVFVRDVGLAAAAFALALSPTAARLPGVDKWLASRPRRGYLIPALSYAALLAVVVGALAVTAAPSAGNSQALSNLGGVTGSSGLGGLGGSAAGGSSAGSGTSATPLSTSPSGTTGSASASLGSIGAMAPSRSGN